MHTMPVEVISRYETMLEKQEIARNLHSYYKNWLRYFLDYCEKYPTPGGNSEHARLFLEKLRQKNQTSMQCQQAAHAIAIFFEMQHLPEDKRDFVGVTETQSVELPGRAEKIKISLFCSSC